MAADCLVAPAQILILTTANLSISWLQQTTIDSVESFPASVVINSHKVCGTTKMFAKCLNHDFLLCDSLALSPPCGCGDNQPHLQVVEF